MLFAETVGKKTQFTSPNYNYKAHIQVKHVVMFDLILGHEKDYLGIILILNANHMQVVIELVLGIFSV